MTSKYIFIIANAKPFNVEFQTNSNKKAISNKKVLYFTLCIDGAVNKSLAYHAIGEAKTVVSLVMLVKIGAGKVGIF